MDPGTFNLMPLYSNTEIMVSEWYDNDKNQFTTFFQVSMERSDQTTWTETLKIRLASTCRDRLFCPKENQDANDDVQECMHCSCSSQCPMKMSCCIRYIEEDKSFMCMLDELQSDTISSLDMAFLAIGSCPKETDGHLRRKCEHPDTNDILQVLPVRDFDEIVFRNVYCGQCNGIFHIKPFDLAVQCNSYVDPSLITTFKEFIEIALEEKCSLKYLSRFNCKEKQNYISKCNTTGLWKAGSTTIQTACESNADSKMSSIIMSGPSLKERNFEEFLNIYCFICNPKDTMPLYDKCNVSGSMTNYEKSDETLCLTGDRDFVWGPYKNVYCLICNTRESEYRGIKDILDNILQPSYRAIFQVPLNFLEIYNQEERTAACPDRNVSDIEFNREFN
ncbi:hypothetical protein CHS0354_031702 [Potamilus streckersoni]|uniref:Uncharacterized protein n=1 Tax=Potamilus streckersoni TaxID=2493646 RepID=A0AAE0W0T1_9BIVA|nr:hypothetical protein CHS0354_031702 [Potamilus streckersoni]